MNNNGDLLIALRSNLTLLEILILKKGSKVALRSFINDSQQEQDNIEESNDTDQDENSIK